MIIFTRVAICLILGQPLICAAQINLDLNETIERMQHQSPSYFKAKNTFERSYWQYQNFRASFKPQLRLSATVPTYLRAISPVTQPDGSIQFVKVSQANNSVGIKLEQNIGITGGVLSAGTGLRRTDNFIANSEAFFLSTPIQLSYEQKSLLYNPFTWSKRIEPLLFTIAERGYSEEMEAIALYATELFFDVLQAQEELKIKHQFYRYADTLFQVSSQRNALGTVSETDVLSLRLNLLKATSQMNDAKVAFASAMMNLKRTAAISTSDTVVLAAPRLPGKIQIDLPKALKQAVNNRKALLELQAARMQADQAVASAKGENSLVMGVSANLGTQQTATKLGAAYQNLQNQQYIGLSFELPILDWGFRKSQIRLAKANRELVEVNATQDELTFEQELYVQVIRFNQQYDQVYISQQADTIAQRSLAITRERYLLGKIGITDLNIATQESITAKQNLISSLRNFWTSYYSIRRLTLYDFASDTKLTYKASL
jgi:hypothetical protein